MNRQLVQRKRPATASVSTHMAASLSRSSQPFVLPSLQYPSSSMQEREERATRHGHSLEHTPIVSPGRKNNTGLPDHLKTGIEALSGLSMDDVQVHYASSQPARIEALAYTQNTHIHVGPGQEQHLPHEIWHVVQQKQGRVKPTLQVEGMAVNDDLSLEREADVMGARAMHTKAHAPSPHSAQPIRHEGGAIGHEAQAHASQATQSTAVVQRFTKTGNRKFSDLPAVGETPYHIATVVAKDGDDNVTLEADASVPGRLLPIFDMYLTLPTATASSKKRKQTFHGTYGGGYTSKRGKTKHPPSTSVLTGR